MKAGSRPTCKDQAAASWGWWEAWAGSRGPGCPGRRGPSPAQDGRPAGRRAGCVGGKGSALLSGSAEGPLASPPLSQQTGGVSSIPGCVEPQGCGGLGPTDSWSRAPAWRGQACLGSRTHCSWGMGVAEATVGGARGGCPAPWLRWLGAASRPGTWAQTICPTAQRARAASGGVEAGGGP